MPPDDYLDLWVWWIGPGCWHWNLAGWLGCKIDSHGTATTREAAIEAARDLARTFKAEDLFPRTEAGV